ncbi:MAG: transcriptional repressor [Bacteroidales bacterium]|jgi:Fe2+ or Zn2+ uptake regulation protein|nr:transcriptional repressor [Bacteroidales bacterium]
MNAQTKDLSAMDRFKSVLKRHSLKATPQRLAVHEAMLSLGHASADQVCELLDSKGGTRVTVASVYNILTQMTLLGIYTHRFSANNKMYFDVNGFKHLHLYDTVNNEFKDVMDDELLEMVESRIKSKRYRGYKVDGVDIQIICHPTTRKNTVTR